MFGVFEACLLDPFVLRKMFFWSFVWRFIFITFFLTVDSIFYVHEQLKFIISFHHVTTMFNRAWLTSFHVGFKSFNRWVFFQFTERCSTLSLGIKLNLRNWGVSAKVWRLWPCFVVLSAFLTLGRHRAAFLQICIIFLNCSFKSNRFWFRSRNLWIGWMWISGVVMVNLQHAVFILGVDIFGILATELKKRSRLISIFLASKASGNWRSFPSLPGLHGETLCSLFVYI